MLEPVCILAKVENSSELLSWSVVDAVFKYSKFPACQRLAVWLFAAMQISLSCRHVTAASLLHESWLHGWVSAIQRSLSHTVQSRLTPDCPVHDVMLSNQHILGLPRPVTPSTRPVITLHSILSCGCLITRPKQCNLDA
jgi:hypothetical protein